MLIFDAILIKKNKIQIFLNFSLIFLLGNNYVLSLQNITRQWQIIVHTFTQAFTSTLAGGGLDDCV